MPRASAIVARTSLTRRSQRGRPDLSVVDLSKIRASSAGRSAFPHALDVSSYDLHGALASHARPAAAPQQCRREASDLSPRPASCRVPGPDCSSTSSSSPALCCPQARDEPTSFAFALSAQRPELHVALCTPAQPPTLPAQPRRPLAQLRRPRSSERRLCGGPTCTRAPASDRSCRLASSPRSRRSARRRRSCGACGPSRRSSSTTRLGRASCGRCRSADPRSEYLTGFSKRKQERKAKARQTAEAREHAERLEIRRSVRSRSADVRADLCRLERSARLARQPTSRLTSKPSVVRSRFGRRLG